MKVRWIEIAINILFWGVTSWFIISAFSIESQEIEVIDGQTLERINRNKDLVYYFFMGQLFFVIYFYIQLFLILSLKGKKEVGIFLLKSIALATVCVFLYQHSARLFLFPEFNHFPAVSHGIFTFYAAVAIGYGFIKVWIRNEQDKNQLHFVKNQAELNLLRSQLHPHFLFNTMNNLLAMVDQDKNPELAGSIDKLSGLLRYVVYETKKEKVTIAHEINFIRGFSELHLLRFEDDEVDFILNLNGTHDQQPIEPGILLCYVENAFKHGVQPEIQSYIAITIDISEANRMVFSIENSIPQEIHTENKGGYGLASNAERLRLAYPDRHTIEIKEDGNYSVCLTLYTDEGNYS